MTHISVDDGSQRREALDFFKDCSGFAVSGLFLLLCQSALMLVCKNVNVKRRQFLYLL